MNIEFGEKFADVKKAREEDYNFLFETIEDLVIFLIDEENELKYQKVLSSIKSCGPNEDGTGAVLEYKANAAPEDFEWFWSLTAVQLGFVAYSLIVTGEKKRAENYTKSGRLAAAIGLGLHASLVN